ncbi:MAG: hypothetical protein KAR09_09455 [Bacteroidales bacterium]|nr:hypothetical protein [Bacteroidales bacterium]
MAEGWLYALFLLHSAQQPVLSEVEGPNAQCPIPAAMHLEIRELDETNKLTVV